jgi:hypothetical protein
MVILNLRQRRSENEGGVGRCVPTCSEVAPGGPVRPETGVIPGPPVY